MENFSATELRYLHEVIRKNICEYTNSEDIHKMKKSLLMKIEAELINRVAKGAFLAAETMRESLIRGKSKVVNS